MHPGRCTIPVKTASLAGVTYPAYRYGDRVSAQKVVGVLVAILVVFWVLSAPVTAAATVNNVLGDLASAGNSVIVFLRGVTA